MKRNIFVMILISLLYATGCVDNELDQTPNDDAYPMRLIVDAAEGGELADAEDYDLEVKFADYIGKLPSESITVDYAITEVEADMIGVVKIDKIIYEIEKDRCVYERELAFTSSNDGLSGTITISSDDDLGSVPESFEIIFALPGKDEASGSFAFELSDLKASNNVILGAPKRFEYATLNNDVAGEWELELENEEQFENFKEIFGCLNSDISDLEFEDITGKIKAEFEFEEMKLVVELEDEEDVTTCENGETETEIVNKEIELEAEYEAEDGDLSLEGSHFIAGEDGKIEDELDFIIEAEYETNEDDGEITFTFFIVIDEDNFLEGEELFRKDVGISFNFKKD
jgi:hypothetical protein